MCGVQCPFHKCALVIKKTLLKNDTKAKISVCIYIFANLYYYDITATRNSHHFEYNDRAYFALYACFSTTRRKKNSTLWNHPKSLSTSSKIRSQHQNGCDPATVYLFYSRRPGAPDCAAIYIACLTCFAKIWMKTCSSIWRLGSYQSLGQTITTAVMKIILQIKM